MSQSSIRFLQRNEIIDERWNQVIISAVNTTIYPYSWYLDAVSPDWGALVEGDYLAVMPLPCRRKYCIRYVFTPPYCQQLGVFAKQPVHGQQLERFIKAIPAEFRYIDLNLNAGNAIGQSEFVFEEKRNLVLQLDAGAEAIRHAYSTNHKRNIRKAVDAGVTIHPGADLETVIRLFEKGRGARLGSYPDSGHSVFRRLCQALSEHAQVGVWVALDVNHNPCGGAVFFEMSQGAYFIFSGVSDEGRANAVMHLLIDRYIEQACLRLRFLDFEGSNNADLARFYSGFGANESLYLHLITNRLPAIIRWAKSS